MRSKLLWLAVAVVLPAVVVSSETGLTERDRARLLLSRATYGARPGDLEALVAQGTESWLDEQLQPERIKDSVVDAKLARFDNLELSTSELMKKYPRPTREERQAMQKAREQGSRMPGMRGAPHDSSRPVAREARSRRALGAPASRSHDRLLVQPLQRLRA